MGGGCCGDGWAAVTVADQGPRLRVLIANERLEHLGLLAEVVAALGHDVIAREIDVTEVAAATARELPDVALVGLGTSSQHALDLIGEIVREASCPVIALLTTVNADFLHEAAERGIFASVFHDDPAELTAAIDITLRRFADYHNLQDAFARRALIEQAKGILMSRNSITADQAFEHLRDASRQNNTKIVDVAAAVIESHRLVHSVAPLVADDCASRQLGHVAQRSSRPLPLPSGVSSSRGSSSLIQPCPRGGRWSGATSRPHLRALAHRRRHRARHRPRRRPVSSSAARSDQVAGTTRASPFGKSPERFFQRASHNVSGGSSSAGARFRDGNPAPVPGSAPVGC